MLTIFLGIGALLAILWLGWGHLAVVIRLIGFDIEEGEFLDLDEVKWYWIRTVTAVLCAWLAFELYDWMMMEVVLPGWTK
jgi:hypothetical protein